MWNSINEKKYNKHISDESVSVVEEHHVEVPLDVIRHDAQVAIWLHPDLHPAHHPVQRHVVGQGDQLGGSQQILL